VPGNGNDRYRTQGYLDVAAGKPRSQGLHGRRQGVAAAPTLASTRTAGSDLYVDYGAGSDSATGTSSTTPLKTIAVAVKKAVSAGMVPPVTVHLQGIATHYVADTIKLSAAHSGTVRGLDRNLHLMMPLSFTPLFRLQLCHECEQQNSSRVSPS
jgi:hypothetical protein